MNVCQCKLPEPALIEHGLYSICEKCGQYVGKAPAIGDKGQAVAVDERAAQAPG